MSKKILHILNGDSLTARLETIGIQDDQLVWREMLCEGHTVFNLDSAEFKHARISYLKTFDANEETYVKSFLKPVLETDYASYDALILWFEYDLFCHINMLAAISHLKQQHLETPIYLVCSGWTEKDSVLKGLAELTDAQLRKHYKEKIRLTDDDIMLADELWRLYCSDNHTFFMEFETDSSSFPYLSSCISAHLQRFPNVSNGLNTLETNILHMIREETIKTKHQLTGYILKYQGFYGFGDLQIQQIIQKLAPFYEKQDEGFMLNRKGYLALDHIKSVHDQVADDTVYGGCKKYEYCYHPSQHLLTKHE